MTPILRLIVELLVVGLTWLAVARLTRPPWRTRLVFLLKAYLTVRVFWLILLHEVDGSTIYATLGELAQELDAWTLVFWSLVATVVRLVGIGASILRWSLMLRGQGIALPARHLIGAFFIGRFLGTFLPSTLGLDGYKLYDAARFSGRTIEVSTATAVEKVLGASGIFGTLLIALPLGVSIFGAQAGLITAIGVPIALTPLLLIALAFLWPGPALIRAVLRALPLPTLRGLLERVADGAGAYSRRKGLLLGVWGLSLVVHFMTAATYYFTARALGVRPVDADFWQVTFASSIQILATVLSPFTVAGEGVRELAQGLLLQNQMTFAVAAASGLLGFLVAEAPTLLGAIPWFLRGERYRPAWGRIDGAPMDFEETRRRAADLGTARPEAAAEGTGVESIGRRLLLGMRRGLAGGAWAGLLIGAGEVVYLVLLGKVVEEAQVFWMAPLGYGVLFAALGALGGSLLAVLPFPRPTLERWIFPLGFVSCLMPFALLATLFFLYRDFFAEQLPPLPLLAGLGLGAALLAILLLATLLLAGRTPLRVFQRARLGIPLFALCILGGAALGAAIGPRPPAAPGPRPIRPELSREPNVLLIIVDTLRADFLPAYGATEVATPTLDRLAAEGTVFDAAFVQASWTKPSIASILTSLYPSAHTAVHKPSRLPDSVLTAAEAFAGAGYTTGGIVTNINLSPAFHFEQGFEEYRYLPPDYLFGLQDSSSRLLLYEIVRRVAARLSGGVRPGQAYQPAEVVNRHALEWLDRHGEERFFLLLHYMEPHDPYFSHPDDGRAIARSTEPHPEPERRDEIVRRYREEIAYLDRRLGELVAALEARGAWDDLLVVLTSDHGEEFQEHGGWWHGLTLYEEQIGVPLLFKWPRGRRVAPARWRGQVRSIDILPTLLARIGAPVPPGMQGEDLLAGGDRERVVYAEEDHEGNVLEAVRAGGWKLIRANEGNPRGLEPLELYSLRRDPGERQDRLATERGRRDRLLARMDELRTTALGQRHGEQQADIGREECERLRALGYVEGCGP